MAQSIIRELSTARKFEPWLPNRLPLVAWWDASRASSYVETGGDIKRLLDIGGNKFHQEQILDPGNEPTVGSRFINGRRVTDFAGAEWLLAHDPRLIENFELPVSAGLDLDDATSSGDAPGPRWIKASNGFGASRSGLVNSSNGGYFSPAKGAQGYAFRYTNSGITTAEEVIGPLEIGVTYYVSFDVVRDNNNPLQIPFNAALLCAPLGTAGRDNCTIMVPTGFTQLAGVQGDADDTGLFTNILFTFTPDEENHGSLVGQDVCLRFKGATTSCIIDNAKVEVRKVGVEQQEGLFNGANTTYDFFAVYQADNVSGTGTIMAFSDQFQNTGDSVILGHNRDTDEIELSYDNGGTPTQYSGGVVDDQTHLVSFSKEAAGAVRLYLDTVLVDSGSLALELEDINTMSMGRVFDGDSSQDLDGAIAEIVVFPFNLPDVDRKRIEGYLMHKWGLADKLAYDHPYKLNPPTVHGNEDQYWLPSDIKTEAWYDAADPDTIVESGGSVSQWDDKSGNNENMVQATGENQFTTNTRELNGLNVLDGGPADYMRKTVFTLPASGNAAFFMVAELDVINNELDSIFSMQGTVSDFQFEADSSSDFNGALNVPTETGSDVPSTGGPFNGPSIYNVNFDKTGLDAYNAYVDGIQRIADTTYLTKLDTTQDFHLFTNRTINNFPDGAIGEVLVVEDCSQTIRQRLEGYLAHKWGLTANLPLNHPYRHVPPTKNKAGVDMWEPSQLTTSAWYDAADADTIDEAAGAVSQWDDKSGNNAHATQSSGTFQPTTGTETINGLNVIDFDNEWLNTASGAYDPRGVFAVIVDDGTAGNNWTFLGANSDDTIGPLGAYYFKLHSQTNGANNDVTAVSTTDVGVDATTPRITGAPFIFGGEIDVSGGDLTTRVYQNGELKNTATGVGLTPKTPTFGAIGAGYFNNSVVDQIDGKIGEIVILPDTPSTAEREKIEGYLAWKWGLVSQLPSTHPYRFTPPEA
jgi:hypothetical protein